MNRRARRGNVIVISAPSGSGKSTVVRRLLQAEAGLEFSISYATRDPRRDERDGREYHFVSVQRFRQMIAKREFAEWARVYGHYYGTPLRQIESAERSGRDIVLDIDVQGHRKVRRRIPRAVSVFLLPPSYRELRQRLIRRHEDSPEAIRARLAAAKEEIKCWRQYDYVVVNDKLEVTVQWLRAIIAAAHLRCESQETVALKVVKTFGG